MESITGESLSGEFGWAVLQRSALCWHREKNLNLIESAVCYADCLWM